MAGVVPVYSRVAIVANTAQQVTADTNVRASSVYFEADGTNTANVLVGLSTVNSTLFFTSIEPGESFPINSDSNVGPRAGNRADLQLSSIYVNAVANSVVHITYLPRIGT